MLCSLVHNISFSYRGSCFIWRDSVGSLWCSKWKYGSHSGTAISYKWFGFQFTFFYFIQCYYFTFFSFDMDSKSWALSVPVFLFQLVAYVDKLGRGTPGVMLSWSRLLNSWSCWNFSPIFLHVVNLAIWIALSYYNLVMLQEEIEKRLVEILGPKTEADNAKPMKKKKEKPTKVEVC